MSWALWVLVVAGSARNERRRHCSRADDGLIGDENRCLSYAELHTWMSAHRPKTG